MTIKEILEELANDAYESDFQKAGSKEKAISQATAKLKALMLKCLPKEGKQWEKFDCTKGEPNENWAYEEGYNSCLSDIKQKVEGL